jgi:GGDEF domain-containing protein
MDRKIIDGYLVFCIVFFLALAAFLVIRVATTWGANADATRADFDVLARETASRYLAAGDFASPAFRGPVKAEAGRRTRLLAAVVYSRHDGVRYAFLRDRELLPDIDLPGWKGSPTYAVLPWGTRLYRIPFAPGHGTDLSMDALYTVVGRQDAFPVIKEALVVLFLFLVLTGIVLLLAPALASDPGSPGEPSSRRAATATQQRRGPRPARDAPQGPELFSPATGLGWRDHLEQRLRFELERAASFDQDLALAVLAIDDFRAAGSTYADAAAAIRRALPHQDMAFEYGTGRFALILPDHDVDAGIQAVDRLRRGFPAGVTFCAGLSARSGRLVSGRTLIAETERALEKASAGGRGRSVGFRADPDKYRAVVAGASAAPSASPSADGAR